jgi:hypothetical protein
VKNITVTLDEKTAAWVRTYAAQRGKSVSRFLGELLQQRMRDVREYNEAMRSSLSKKPFKFDWVGGQKPTREDLHDRTGLR